MRKVTAPSGLDDSTTCKTEPSPQGRSAALSYVGEPFDYDLFVSYAHLDPRLTLPEHV